MNCHWPWFFQGGTSIFVRSKIIADRETDKQLDFPLGRDFWNRGIGSSNMGLLSWCLNGNRKHSYLIKPLQNQTPIIYLFVSKRKFYVGPLDILIGKHHQVFHTCSRAGYHSAGGSKWGGGDPSVICRVGCLPGSPFWVLPAACMPSLLTLLSPVWYGDPDRVWEVMVPWACTVLSTHMSCSGHSARGDALLRAKQSMVGSCGKEMCLQELRQEWLTWDRERPLAPEWPGCWQQEQLVVLCHYVPVQQCSTYLLKPSWPATALQAPPAAPESCSHREAWPQLSSVPHYSPGSTSAAISVHSSLWFTVASLSASYSLPKHLGKQWPVSGFGHLAQALESHGKPRDTLWRCNILVLVPIAFL